MVSGEARIASLAHIIPKFMLSVTSAPRPPHTQHTHTDTAGGKGDGVSFSLLKVTLKHELPDNI